MTKLETSRKAGMSNVALRPDSTATPFSTFISAVASDYLSAAEALLADDIVWDLMPTGQKLKGKPEVIPWLRAGATSRKEPVTISNLAAKDWGIFEYWNIGVVTEELVAFGNRQKWPWPKDPNSLVGQKYKVAQCFVWHLNAEGKIRPMRQYLDTGSVWTQFK